MFRPKLHPTDRVLLCWLSGLWSGWRSALLIVQPQTIVGWHRQGFKLYWRWKSRKKPGRPKVDAGEDPSPEVTEVEEKSIQCQRWLGGLLNHYYRQAA